MNVTSTCRDINELHSVAQVACRLFLEECKKAGLDIFITETYRSQERQDYLYAQGRSRPGPVVTWTLKSNHKSRLAWDIACNKPSLYDAGTLKKAGLIAMNLGIGWGGVWKNPDMPHFEVTTQWKEPSKKIMWGKTELKKGQIGKITILKPINLWQDSLHSSGELEEVRVLNPDEEYRVYGYRELHGGQYDVGGGHWVTKMDGYIKYETPSKAML
jgi:D-alanyl-D-alanine carboxypeptidase